MKKVLISGGTGLIGSQLAKLLQQQGLQVIILTRNPDEHASTDTCKYMRWDISKQEIDPAAFREVDAIIHLAGAGVADKRWTEKRKQVIIDSRVKSSALLIESLRRYPHQVKTFVSASAIGWYGKDEPGRKPFIETDPAAEDFLGTTCEAWEAAVKPVEELGIRLAILRTGIVFSNKGGAFAEFKKPAKWGLSTILGSGKQIISWIHINDMCRLYYEALKNETISGIYNAVGPNPASNREVVTGIAKKIKGRFYIPVHVPSFALRLALGEMSTEVLKSTTVSCEKLRHTGFSFQYPSLSSALEELLGKH